MTEQLTRDEILALKPGRELDALVAEKVMGWKVAQVFDLKDTDGTNIANGITPYNIGQRVPHYSTDISAAWEVVEKMSEQWPQYQLAKIEDGWSVMWGFDGYGWPEATGKTAPEAICKAALLAVMEEWR